MSNSLHPITNPALEISDMDDAGEQPMALCALPTGGGYVRYAVPKMLLPLIALFDGRRSIDSAIAAYRVENPDCWSANKLRELVSGFLIPRGLVLIHEGAEAGLLPDKGGRRSFLYISLPLIGPGIVEPVARALGWAYRPVVLAAWLPLFLVMTSYFLLVLVPNYDLDFNNLNIIDVFSLIVISTISTLFHEFGHASAAMHFGCRHLRIGWGLYLVFTVMWTDVSDAWKLRRWQRAVIDVAGVYLESFFVLGLMILFKVTGDIIYLFGVMFAFLNMATSFNPFLRLDGYWLMSDAFGIVNLREKQMSWLRHAVARLLGRPDSSSGKKPDLGRHARIALAVYSVMSIAFLCYLLKLIWERVILSVATQYPQVLANFWQQAVAESSLAGLVAGGLEILWRTLMLAALVFMLVRMIQFLAGPFRQKAGSG